MAMVTTMNAKLKQIEKILGTPLDGVWDEKDQSALDKLSGQGKKKPAPTAAPADMLSQMAGAQPQTYT